MSHVVRVDQAADHLQGAEGVVLTVVLTTAGIPDQVPALLIGQYIGCGSLWNNNTIGT